MPITLTDGAAARASAPLRGRAAGLSLLLALMGVALAPDPSGAQETGARRSVQGRVLDRDHLAPIAAAVVRVTAEDTRASHTDTTDASGSFSLDLPRGAGPFALRAERVGYVALSVGLAADDFSGGVARRDLRLSAEVFELPGLVVSRSRPARGEAPVRSPGGSEETMVSWSTGVVPLDPGDLAGMAAMQPGVHPADEGGGLSFFGQDPSQSRTTLDGASFGATSVPQEALATATVVTSAYDVARGQYLGGMVEATTLGGTNLFGGAVRSRLSHPQMQWRPQAGATRWPESTLGHAEGAMGGAVVLNRLFWYVAGSASRRSAPLVSLESAAPSVLAGLGAHPDSAARLRALLHEGGPGPDGAGLSRAARTDMASALLRLDYDVSDRHSLMLRLDGRRSVLEGLGVDPLSTLGSGATASGLSGGVLAQLTSGFGAVTNELRAYRAENTQRIDPVRAGPSGVVRIASPPEEPAGGTVLRFGGGNLDSESGGSLVELSDELSAALGGGHELKAGFLVSDQRVDFASAGNRFGTFTFNTLDDFETGRAALFTRTLGERAGEARTRYGALFLGDTWNRGRLALTYGARLEGRSYPGGAGPRPGAEPPFAARPGRVPPEWGVSPRFGWTYDGERWDLRGGAGEFRGAVPLHGLASALMETGSADQAFLHCVGPATPSPAWERYAADPGSAPTECEGGAPAFAARTPPVTVFAADFTAPRTWHTSLGATTQLTGRVRLHLDASLTRGSGQPMAFDLNLNGTPEFRLPAEGGRAVYAAPSSIDPGTGGVAPGASRLVPGWGIVREISAGGSSTVAQATGTLNVYYPRFGVLISGAYTHNRAWDEVGALPALGGSSALAYDPARPTRAASDRERRHDFQLRLTIGPRPWVRVGFLGRLTSGAPFTPRVDGDVNGDGSRSDPAFVFDPASTADTSLAAGMRRLLDQAPAPVRGCLAGQFGKIARRNSCRAGWTSALDLRADFQPWRRSLDRRLKVSLVTNNGLALVDRLLHGGDAMRGWGGPALVDPTLLRVRGFDPAAQAFRYGINPAFGTRLAGGRLVRPFSLTVEARLTVGADPAYQPLQRLLNETLGPGRSPEELRNALASRIPNLAAQVVWADSGGGIGLAPPQRDLLLLRSDSLGARLAPLADSLAVLLSDLENGRRRRSGAAWKEVGGLTDRISVTLQDELDGIRRVLTPEQWERLPDAIRTPSRQFLPDRDPGGPIHIR